MENKMNLKDKLILISDKLDRLGLQKDADVIDSLLTKIASKGIMELLEELPSDDEEKSS
jgi:hypothetical protein|tara:strand:- start:4508 stop:4684 length:177 start_codon:yes stop_codon:yes gene_type:complete